MSQDVRIPPRMQDLLKILQRIKLGPFDSRIYGLALRNASGPHCMLGVCARLEFPCMCGSKRRGRVQYDRRSDTSLRFSWLVWACIDSTCGRDTLDTVTVGGHYVRRSVRAGECSLVKTRARMSTFCCTRMLRFHSRPYSDAATSRGPTSLLLGYAAVCN